jgi:hypothetical protein
MVKTMRALREEQQIENVWGKISEHTNEGYFWVSNLVKSKKSGSIFFVLEDFIASHQRQYNWCLSNSYIRNLPLILYASASAQTWRVHYNTKRPHTSLRYRPPAPETIQISNTIMTYEN